MMSMLVLILLFGQIDQNSVGSAVGYSTGVDAEAVEEVVSEAEAKAEAAVDALIPPGASADDLAKNFVDNYSKHKQKIRTEAIFAYEQSLQAYETSLQQYHYHQMLAAEVDPPIWLLFACVLNLFLVYAVGAVGEKRYFYARSLLCVTSFFLIVMLFASSSKVDKDESDLALRFRSMASIWRSSLEQSREGMDPKGIVIFTKEHFELIERASVDMRQDLFDKAKLKARDEYINFITEQERE